MTTPGAVARGVAGSVPGSVAENLLLFRGVWHDVVSAHELDGTPMPYDAVGGTPGASPYDQIVYVDFDGVRFTQTNVVLSGRDVVARTFSGVLRDDGVLLFDPPYAGAPELVGVSGGPGVLVFAPSRVDDPAVAVFADPDYIRHLGGDQRSRTTTCYRDGVLVRVLTVRGTRISHDPSHRVARDPRGPQGPVHRSSTAAEEAA